MQNWRSVSEVPTAEHMIQKLAGVCNGASTHDALGFSKMDTSFGHSLAERSLQGRAWSVKQAHAALKLLRKYSRQLGGKEFVAQWMLEPNFHQLPAEPASQTGQSDRKLVSDDQTAVFQFKYNPELVVAIKQIRGEYKGEKYRALFDGVSKTWRVPVNRSSIMQIMQLARAWEFDVETRFEVYYARVVEAMQPVLEAAEESRVVTSLGYEPGVQVQDGVIEITHADPQVLAEFQAALGKLS